MTPPQASEAAVGGRAEILADLDRLIKTQAMLQFARHDYNAAQAEVYGIALLDFMRVHGMELRRIVAGEQPATAAEPVAWRYRWHDSDMPWSYIDGPMNQAPGWLALCESQPLYAALQAPTP